MASLIVPSWVQALVGKIKEISPATHVAGGFLRDLDNGKSPKDLDVFVPEDVDIGAIEGVVTASHTMFGEAHLNDPRYDAHTGLIASSREYIEPSGTLIPVNVIQIPGLKRDPFWNINRFDFGICQISWQTETGVVRTSRYFEDQDKQDFTLVNCDSTSQYVRALRRWERINPRYPGWRMYVPKRFRMFSGEDNEDVL